MKKIENYQKNIVSKLFTIEEVEKIVEWAAYNAKLRTSFNPMWGETAVTTELNIELWEQKKRELLNDK